jgi:uncharacterized membrane protein
MLESIMSLPPVPPPEARHVLIVHVPIGVLLIAPLFVVLAMLFRRWFGWAALVLLLVGTTAAWAAVYTGRAARDVVEDGPQAMFDLIEKHEALAIQASQVFIGLTVAYALILLLSVFSQNIAKLKVWVPLNLVFLGCLGLAILMLSNAAHQGGYLVHVHGVHAALGVETPNAEKSEADKPAAEPSTGEEKPAQAEAGKPADNSTAKPAEGEPGKPAEPANPAASEPAAPAKPAEPAGDAAPAAKSP